MELVEHVAKPPMSLSTCRMGFFKICRMSLVRSHARVPVICGRSCWASVSVVQAGIIFDFGTRAGRLLASASTPVTETSRARCKEHYAY